MFAEATRAEHINTRANDAQLRSRSMSMMFAILACLAACSSGQLDDDLSGSLTGRLVTVSGNPYVGEIVSRRSTEGRLRQAILVSANLGSSPGVSSPGMALLSFHIDIDCERHVSRVVRQGFHDRDGDLIRGFDLTNDYSSEPGMRGLVLDVCENRPITTETTFTDITTFYDTVRSAVGDTR